MRVPWTASRSNQSILKEISPEYSLEGLVLKLKPPDVKLKLWPPDVKSQLTGKDPDTGKNGGQEKGATEDDTIGWHYRLKGNEFVQTQGDSEGQGSLACCSSWGHKELDMTEQLHFHFQSKSYDQPRQHIKKQALLCEQRSV